MAWAATGAAIANVNPVTTSAAAAKSIVILVMQNNGRPNTWFRCAEVQEAATHSM
jgi:hypothetical protein